MPNLNGQTSASGLFWRALAWCSIGLGAAGTVLPLVPTTPFLLLAAWAAPKGSPRLNTWLHTHPTFGPVLKAWREQRAVPLRAKCTATGLLIASWAGLWLVESSAAVLWLTAILFICVAVFLLTRPNGGEVVDE
ncbi:YbaN family protein [Kineobactrum salinum]|uniref:Inner membrane protein n=1 Tax=Kineobactrum salinum TaxID=2708301 RepID=A0A6C0U7H5_9GAMM|nr:YbaN family protein [Kineobactrum salinum]QIB66927.1 DUF454 domain-containing protein [Kineobactrum salinum]